MTEHGGAAALKQNNLAALRSALYHTYFATKKELAEQCRLSLAACTALLGEMIDDGTLYDLTVQYFGETVADSTSLYQK